MKQTAIILCIIFLLTSCRNNSNKKEKYVAPVLQLSKNEFVAIPMPSKLVSGNSFPTDSALINSWITNSESVNNLEINKDIIIHGWGIWQALTEITNQSNNGQRLRRFEAWYTPDDIIRAYKIRKQNSDAKLNHVKRNTGALKKFNQLHGNALNIEEPADISVIGFVKYDPTAAEHIFANDLFYRSKLKGMIQTNKIVNIPDFPNSGVTLKPVFAPLDSISPETGLYVLPVWPGNDGNSHRPFGSEQWNNYVSITINGKTNAPEHTYSIHDFIHFQLDSLQAKSSGGKPGDYAVLQAMHVTTRETKRWTWQTYWWSENMDAPQSPSSSIIAGLRPTNKLDNGASHYAMSIAYNMVQPAQPFNGGSGVNTTSLYAYNPYLEAGFDKDVFADANDTIQKYYAPGYQKTGGVLNEYGMQTNCMSCHGQARYIPGLSGRKAHLYITDQYFELNAPYFRNTVKLDFTWSIQGNLINDDEKLIKN